MLGTGEKHWISFPRMIEWWQMSKLGDHSFSAQMDLTISEPTAAQVFTLLPPLPLPPICPPPPFLP